MITSAIVYAIVSAALLSAAAFAAEHAARVLRQPTRWVWFIALSSSLLWPAGAVLLARFGTKSALTPVVLDVQHVTAVAATATVGPSHTLTLDRFLLAAWLTTSALLVLRLALSATSIRRRRLSWHTESIDGVAVRLSDSVGPAVVGLRTMEVVVPRWLRSLEPHLRAMVLAHESEHRDARDPLLLFAASLAVALMPWNVAVWWQAKRLRLAVEMDCDARVLRRHGDSERYGLLLLTIAQRSGASGMSFATMLSEPVSQLERRIDAMNPPVYRSPKVRASFAASCALIAFIAACAIGSPDQAMAPKVSMQSPPHVSTEPYFEFQVEQAVTVAPGNGAPRYPDILRSANQEGSVLAQFVVHPNGQADSETFKVLKSSHALFTAAVKEWVVTAHFQPALVGGKPVSQVVQMPFQFNLAHGTTYEAAAPMSVDQIRAARKVATPRPTESAQRVQQPANSTADTLHILQSASNENRREVSVPGVKALSYVRAGSIGKPYYEFQIEKRAQLLQTSGAPAYPAELRQQKVEGEVLAQFVVTESGQAVPSSVKILKTTDPLFTAAVRRWLGTAQFEPAEVAGKKVKQLMQMPFAFNLSP